MLKPQRGDGLINHETIQLGLLYKSITCLFCKHGARQTAFFSLFEKRRLIGYIMVLHMQNNIQGFVCRCMHNLSHNIFHRTHDYITVNQLCNQQYIGLYVCVSSYITFQLCTFCVSKHIFSVIFIVHIFCICLLCTSLGDGVEKPSSVALVFQVFSTIQGKTKAKHFCYFSSEALQLL